MGYFKLHYTNKTNLIFIAALLWTINFRVTFKNVYAHMGMGSYAVLRFDPLLILIKNVACLLYIIGFIYEVRANKASTKVEKQLVQKQENDKIYVELKEIKNEDQNDLINTVSKSHNLTDCKSKIFFGLKVFFMILIIYASEEFYFCISNNHVLDRVIVPMRNFGILIALSIFSPLLIKKSCRFYRHQYIPYIIIFIISIAIVYYNFRDRERFKKKFGSYNTFVYLGSYFFIGVESVFIKYLVDKEFISIFLILSIKGIIGTIIFIVINILYNQEQFYALFEEILNFEYSLLNEPFSIFPKILYVLSFIFLAYFKMYVINQFTENHILSTIMIVDLIYFPIYIFERLVGVKFKITTPSSFIINSVAGFVNFFLMLIFNEILELKFCGFNTNLSINITKRQKKERISDVSINSESEDSSRTSNSSNIKKSKTSTSINNNQS